MDNRGIPEITVKAVVLGVVLSMVMAGANAYLGLMAGMTVCASIPAAVISMAVLRFFRRVSILENNMVQTAASSGESLAAGAVFTLPALILLGAWSDFDYWQTTLIATLGGMLGVLFTVPLRRALILEAKLAFPEGVATAKVLEVGDRGGPRQAGAAPGPSRGGAGVGLIAAGGALGALFKVGETGLRLWTGSVEAAARVGGGVAYFGASLAPALLAVGYIVGLNIAALVFLGGAANWLVEIPLLAVWRPMPPGAEPVAWAWRIWGAETRYLGVGAMIVGGLWTIVRMWPSLLRGIRSGVAAYRHAHRGVQRTDRDVPMQWVGIALALSVVPLFFVFRHFTGNSGVAALLAAVMLVAGFLFSAVASYMAGVVGSSNNPISGVTIATVLTTALLLLALGTGSAAGPAAAILVGAVVCCAAAIGGDVMQDLKTGQLVGATPWKQQVMEAVSVLAAALVIAPILSLLLNAYGIGEATAARPNALRAPQATLMASVAKLVFTGGLPWIMVASGGVLAVGIIVLDEALRLRGSRFRTPVLAVAVGIYLPFELGVAIFAGGLAAWAAQRVVRRRGSREDPEQPGVLFAAGLITGEALLGILLAIPIVLNKGGNPLDVDLAGGPLTWPGLALFGLVVLALHTVGTRRVSRTA
ncbi:MAG TPA: oligopeptide transporter, OPT family [Planctomycetota bacterium]|nr:oligopeptide transporter, OPT family [Planctomycetota bacterium]